MSRVLIWRRMNPGSELDIFHPTDYPKLYDRVMDEWNGVSQNWGNRLWFQGIYSALDNGDNIYDFLEDPIDPEKINSEYDFIILSLANVFCPEYLSGLRNYAEIFEKIRIPVFVIACGVQADGYNDLNRTVDIIGSDSSRFIRAVYNTGGEFALRGYFTKEFFDKLGFSSAVVTGCPSMYQFGSDFRMDVGRKNATPHRPVFNGRLKFWTKLMEAYPDSRFIDQDECFRPMFQPDYLNHVDMKFKLDFMNRYGTDAAKMLARDRICMIADTNDWWNYLQKEGFDFSFGSRIHGTIMAILSGIPSVIVACDSRTREMAEYFDIPMLLADKNHYFTEKEVLDAYARMDYSGFNAGFEERFGKYEKFFTDHGIVSHINTENKFLVRESGKSYEYIHGGNKADFDKLYANISASEPLLLAVNKLRQIKRRLF